MAKKTNGQRPSKAPGATADAVVPVSQPVGRRLAKAGEDTAASVFKEEDVTLVVGRLYPMGELSILTDAIYYVGDAKPRARNGRLGDADKIAWRDPATGYECIIMRNSHGGYLSGYVAVPPGHPLYGFDHDAIPPDFDIEVHGGLTYSSVCDEGPSPRGRLMNEARSICHVPQRFAAIEHATDYRAGHDRAWWLGFECNHVYDVVPGDRTDRSRFLGNETGATLRDEAYVYGQVVDLAAQLRAIADGRPKPARTGMKPPPLGLDPKKAG